MQKYQNCWGFQFAGGKGLSDRYSPQSENTNPTILQSVYNKRNTINILLKTFNDLCVLCYINCYRAFNLPIMSKQKKDKMPQKDYLALLKLDLFKTVGVSGKSEEDQKKYAVKFSELGWTLFLQTAKEDLSDKDVQTVQSFKDKMDFEGLDKYLGGRFAHIKERLAYFSLLAKQMVIAQHLGKLMFIVKNKDVKDKDSLMKELEYIARLVKERKWEEFAKVLDKLENIRGKLDEQ